MKKRFCVYCGKIYDADQYDECPFCHKDKVKDIDIKVKKSRGVIKRVPSGLLLRNQNKAFVKGETTLFVNNGKEVKNAVFDSFDFKNNKQVIYFTVDNKRMFSVYPGNLVFFTYEDAYNALSNNKIITTNSDEYPFIIESYSYPKALSINGLFEKEQFITVIGNVDSLIYHEEKKPDESKSLFEKANQEYALGVSIDRDYYETNGIADPFNQHYMYAEDYYKKARLIKDKRDEKISELKRIRRKPYFARLDFGRNKNDLHTVYLGEHEIEGYVKDWRDTKAGYLYFHTDIVGGLSISLALKRIFKIEDGKYIDYRDEINEYQSSNKVTSGTSDSPLYGTDELFNILLKESRDDESIHNIIKTIRSHQYNIITYDKEKNIVVEGCAGSGKTMILYHRLSYIAYNDKSFNPKNVFVISPSMLFKNSTDELVKSLYLNDINNIPFYNTLENFIYRYCRTNNIVPSLTPLMNNKYQSSLNKDFYSEAYYEDFKSIYSETDFKSLYFRKYLNDLIMDLLSSTKLEEILPERVISCSKEGYGSPISKSFLLDLGINKEMSNLRTMFSIKNFEAFVHNTKNKEEVNRRESLLKKYRPLISFFTSSVTLLTDKGTEAVNNIKSLFSEKKIKQVIQCLIIENIIDCYNKYLDTDEDSYITPIVFDFVTKTFNEKHKLKKDMIYDFERVYLLRFLNEKFGYLSIEKTYCFIDEFQNYSLFEIKTITDIFSNVIVNLFGDINQQIDSKGVDSIEEFSSLGDMYDFVINDNYRNAKEITEYINNKLGMNMNMIGLHGEVEEISLENLSLSLSGRTAFICKEEHLNDIVKMIESTSGVHINNMDETEYIDRDSINVISINNVKGLEFDKAYVYLQGMSKNEMYVSLTRALKSLVVIK